MAVEIAPLVGRVRFREGEVEVDPGQLAMLLQVRDQAGGEAEPEQPRRQQEERAIEAGAGLSGEGGVHSPILSAAPEGVNGSRRLLA